MAQTQPTLALEPVVVTGSHIPRTDLEGALPVQVITRDDIDRSGVTRVEQLLDRVAANINGFGLALTVGEGDKPGLSGANLRGLGTGSTLVLLNGRRLANYAFDGETVDLNTIPVAAIDRVEILKDGASAIYGTDAIAGVINFILRRDFQGIDVNGGGTVTEHGGGNGAFATLTYGYGDPASDGINVFGTVSYQKDQRLRAIDRDFARTAYRPEDGIDNLSRLTFPGNIVDRRNQRILNPSTASGCAPPDSVPWLVPPFSTPGCGYDFAPAIDLLPAVERSNAMLRANWRIDQDITGFAEAMAGHNRFEVQLAPSPVNSFTRFGPAVYPADGPFYPSAFAAANGLAGDLTVTYRAIELGPRKTTTTSDSERLSLGAEGKLFGWDVNIAAAYDENRQSNEYVGGHLYTSRFIPALATGLINPFGPSGPEGKALLSSIEYRGTPQTAKGSTALVNAVGSTALAQLAAGKLALATGGEARRESLSYDWDAALLSGDPLIGTAPRPKSGSRNVLAIFSELELPIVRGLGAQLAVRRDDYSDFGTTTNPKVALRWQPATTLLLRTSWGKGFRAPPLYALNEPKVVGDPVAGIEDPIRCPTTGTTDDCLGIVDGIRGGNPDLRSETSTQWSAGIVWEPLRRVSIAVDYWRIEQRGVISDLDVDTALRYYDRFADRFIRGPADPQQPGLPGPIIAVDLSKINIGTTRTSGFDVALDARLSTAQFGVVHAVLQGTLVRHWETQFDGVNYVSALGDASATAPVPRWRSTATLDWSRGHWGITLAHNFSGGYTDELPDGNGDPRRVRASQTWDVQGRFDEFKGWRFAAGVQNLFNADPPLSNQTQTFQAGFNPKVASPLGRQFYVRAGYAAP